MINDLAEIISINTVRSEPVPNGPFGAGNRKALEWFLKKASSYGLKCGEDSGYAAWAEYGEGKKLIGILGHLDVVPPGEGWSTNPFELEIERGNLYGRGVSDDKGPVVACLHALKKLHDSRVNLGARVRLIVGFNEENGSACMAHYVSHCEIPDVSFTPDADFPVVASEKGIMHIELAASVKELGALVTGISGGTRPNIVPNAASFVIPTASPLYEKAASLSAPGDIFKTEKTALTLASYGYTPSEFSIEHSKEGFMVSAAGVAAHGSAPEKGDNALAKIFALLYGLTGAAELKYFSDLSFKHGASAFNLGYADESGALTLNAGTCCQSGDELKVVIDVRRPYSMPAASVENALKILPSVKMKVLYNSNTLFKPDDDKLVQLLLGVYRKVTGDYDSLPLRIGGGTYAKELPNCLGFGATFPGVDTRMHEPDEFYPVEHFYRLVEIYCEAVKELAANY